MKRLMSLPKVLVAGGIAIVALIALVGAVFAANPWGGRMNPQAAPNQAQEGTPGSGLGTGQGFGCGMMGGAYPGNGAPANGSGQAISIDQAAQSVRDYVGKLNNSDLTLDEVMEFQNNFYAIVKEKSTGTGAFEVLVNKYTGAVFPEMGPNMMWNTKYGHMGAGGMMGGMMGNGGMMGGSGMMGGGMMGGVTGGQSYAYPGTIDPSKPMSVTADQATQKAKDWLDQNMPGTTTEAPDQFYGYYTIHTLKDGKPSGMLSVNGYTGAIWYHTWHGDFIKSMEAGQSS